MSANTQATLTLLDSVCLIVGIIVGAGIYQVAPGCGQRHPQWTLADGAMAGGGSFRFAARSIMPNSQRPYPQEGGDYAYLTRAYGRWAGFLFGWIQLAIVRPGDIAVMAFAFAIYARTLYDPVRPKHPRLKPADIHAAWPWPC